MVSTEALPGAPFSGAFLFEVDGREIGRFKEVEGLEVEVEVYEYEEGGGNDFVHRLPGRVRWPNLVLRGGLTRGDALFAWLRTTTGGGLDANGGKLERSTGAITVLDQQGNRVRTWSFEGAFPVRWRGPRLTVSANEPLVEELEITHNGFQAQTL